MFKKCLAADIFYYLFTFYNFKSVVIAISFSRDFANNFQSAIFFQCYRYMASIIFIRDLYDVNCFLNKCEFYLAELKLPLQNHYKISHREKVEG